MHQSRTQADSPQRRGADLVAAALKILFREVAGHLLEDAVTVMLANGLQDSVAGAHVVHEEISERMQGDGAKCGRNRERATVDFCSCGSGGQCFDVASRTADLVEQRVALLCSRAAGKLRVASGSFAGAYEAGEAIDVGKAVCAGLVIRLCGSVANIGDLVWLQAIGYAHLVEIGVAGER